MRSTSDFAAPRLQLLGGFACSVGGSNVPIPTTAQRVLAYLAVVGGPVMRPRIAAILWPDVDDQRSFGSLRSALCQMQGARDSFVNDTGAGLRLKDGLSVDLPRSVDVARLLVSPQSRHAASEVDVAALSHDLLPGWDEEWLNMEQERFRQMRLHALEALSELYTRQQRYAEAIEAALRAIAGEPLRESARRALIRAHVAEGNVAEAITHYEVLRELLLEEFNVQPSQATRSLISTFMLA